eukprot:TRINITY_DN10345_c0_g1_i4.p1 TRINITY_DN10345_c0_g1~~TRINITY_DN10345_c0_g1_i4.p1  ORF type:complete len:201 (+),score=39.84 TRINITY_DN10345_c0_g1_i4:1211-1813(+)
MPLSTMHALLYLAFLVPAVAFSTGAPAAACGFDDPNGGRPGGPNSDTHGSRVNGNGMFALTTTATAAGSSADQVVDTISLSHSGSTTFVGFLIQTNAADVTLATSDSQVKSGACAHQSLTHTSSTAKKGITFTSTRPNTTNVEYRVTVLGTMRGSYWIFDTTPTDPAMTTAMPITTAGSFASLASTVAALLSGTCALIVF